MTRDELLAILTNPTGDTESDHSRADDALLAFINDPAITAAFEALERWYA